MEVINVYVMMTIMIIVEHVHQVSMKYHTVNVVLDITVHFPILLKSKMSLFGNMAHIKQNSATIIIGVSCLNWE